MKTSEWALIGEIVGWQGNRGEIKVIPHSEFPERFSQMKHIRLFKGGAESPAGLYELENQRFHKGSLILKLKGIETIAQAEALRGMQIKISRGELMPLPPASYYIFQLIGLQCVSVTGEKLGVLVDVLETGANDVYLVRPAAGATDSREILIPALKSVVLEVDLKGKKMVVDLPEGLLD